MFTSLFDPQTLFTYCLAAAALVAAPGPAQALIIARTIQHGRPAGFATIAGLQVGTFLHTMLAAFGLSAVLATSATAFTVVKYVGAAYLVILGVRALWSSREQSNTAPQAEASSAVNVANVGFDGRSGIPADAAGESRTADVSAAARVGGAPDAGAAGAHASVRWLIVHGAVTGTLNPKVAIFFLAFLPQFVHPERGGVFIQFLVLGILLILISCLGDGLVVWAVGKARTRLLSSTRFSTWRERLTGIMLIGLGLRLALIERK